MCIKMSDVRLSNASPTLERVDARLPDSTRPSVRRCLFGSPDREEQRDIFESTMRAEEQRFRDTYNFDPVEGRPLSPGRYRWEVFEDAPEFYRRPPHGRLNRSRSSHRDQVETTPRDQEETTPRDQVETTPRDQVETTPRDQVETTPRDQEETTPRDQAQTAQGQTAERERSRKRPSDPSGSSCSSSEPRSKSSRTNGDDEDDQADGGSCSQAAQVPEQAPEHQ